MTRKQGMRTVMAALLGVGMFAGGASARPAPAFSLTDIEGKTHALADYKGRFVVLEWVNHECPFVKKHYKTGNMQALQKSMAATNVVWLSINSSAPGKQGNYTADAWKAKTAEYGAAPAAVLLDADGTVGHAYGAKTTPHLFVINPEGEIIYEGAIDDKPTFNDDDVPGAHNYVQAALASAMSGGAVETPVTASYGCSVKY